MRRKFVSPLRVEDGDFLVEIADVSQRADEKEYAIAVWEFRVYGDGFHSIQQALNNAISVIEKLRMERAGELNIGTTD